MLFMQRGFDMNTQNDADNAADFEALYLAYKAKYEFERQKVEDAIAILNELKLAMTDMLSDFNGR